MEPRQKSNSYLMVTQNIYAYVNNTDDLGPAVEDSSTVFHMNFHQ